MRGSRQQVRVDPGAAPAGDQDFGLVQKRPGRLGVEACHRGGIEDRAEFGDPQEARSVENALSMVGLKGERH